MFFRRALFKHSLLVLTLVSALCAADEPRRIYAAEATKAGVGQNIGFVEKLVHESATAKKILQSDNPEAKALHADAVNFLDQAKAAQAKGDATAVAEALNKAKKAVFTAMRLLSANVVKEKKQENYQQKRKGLESLLIAHERLRKELAAQENTAAAAQHAEQTESHIKEKLTEAQGQYDAGKVEDAGATLNDAYLGLKLSITKLRDGTKLVRSLNFETIEDEYRYELRRNDTHNMLVNTVLKEKRADPRFGKLMDIPLKKAEQLRADAEQKAASGDHAGAIKVMEESTKNIIRAIRMAGIFIPG